MSTLLPETVVKDGAPIASSALAGKVCAACLISQSSSQHNAAHRLSASTSQPTGARRAARSRRVLLTGAWCVVCGNSMGANISQVRQLQGQPRTQGRNGDGVCELGQRLTCIRRVLWRDEALPCDRVHRQDRQGEHRRSSIHIHSHTAPHSGTWLTSSMSRESPRWCS